MSMQRLAHIDIYNTPTVTEHTQKRNAHKRKKQSTSSNMMKPVPEQSLKITTHAIDPSQPSTLQREIPDRGI